MTNNINSFSDFIATTNNSTINRKENIASSSTTSDITQLAQQRIQQGNAFPIDEKKSSTTTLGKRVTRGSEDDVDTQNSLKKIKQEEASTYQSSKEDSIEKNFKNFLDALIANDVSTAKKCLEADATSLVNRANNFGWTPLMFTATNGCYEMIPDLLNRGAKINVCDFFQRTALIFAAQAGKVECVQSLAEAGAKIDIQDDLGYTALIYAAQNNNRNCLNSLIKAEAKVDIQDKKGKTALIYATQADYMECTESLIEAGAKVNIQDKKGNTALIYAAQSDYMECIESLIEAGAKIDIQNNEGETALDIAKKHQSQEAIDFLDKLLNNQIRSF